MPKFYFPVLENIHFDAKMLKSASYVLIYAASLIFLLEMAAILKNARHFDFFAWLTGFLIEYMP